MRYYKGIEIRKHEARNRWTVQVSGNYDYPSFPTLRAAKAFIDRMEIRCELNQLYRHEGVLAKLRE
jgi:hypothetical protein